MVTIFLNYEFTHSAGIRMVGHRVMGREPEKKYRESKVVPSGFPIPRIGEGVLNPHDGKVYRVREVLHDLPLTNGPDKNISIIVTVQAFI